MKTVYVVQRTDTLEPEAIFDNKLKLIDWLLELGEDFQYFEINEVELNKKI